MAKLVAEQNEDFARVLLFIRHVRNFHEIGFHPIRAEALAAENALERALGEHMKHLYGTKVWKSGTVV